MKITSCPQISDENDGLDDLLEVGEAQITNPLYVILLFVTDFRFHLADSTRYVFFQFD